MTPAEAVVQKCTHRTPVAFTHNMKTAEVKVTYFDGACSSCIAAALEEAKMSSCQKCFACGGNDPTRVCVECHLIFDKDCWRGHTHSVLQPSPSLREQVEQVRKQIEAAYPDAQLGAWMSDPLAVILTTFALAQRQAQRTRDAEIAREQDTTMDCPAACRCLEMRERIATAIEHDPEGA